MENITHCKMFSPFWIQLVFIIKCLFYLTCSNHAKKYFYIHLVVLLKNPVTPPQKSSHQITLPPEYAIMKISYSPHSQDTIPSPGPSILPTISIGI